MLKRTLRRENDQLKQRLAAAIERRDEAIGERDAAVRLNSRLANKVTDATQHADRAARAWSRVVHDANQAEYLFARASRLLQQREARHRATVADLRAQLAAARRNATAEKSRADALADRVHTLTTANQRGDWPKPAMPAAA